ncbi:50S ribosomal protein L4 [Deinococcus radiodurans]|jgi:LSU ribosomal protein L4P|uniref:Large ribosomal subunit protein uL4 n=4 Tax=Bacteria TaxID=2 RepID=RL4_DEIRA|nr:50S ribosomal protein L4 [Deinococcus radiodurans]Q9RXK1.3 RecName: Full=Large ribosomal subunit protein uL4; AltName: Full=50S ribosomal protein L4 [Deinococcus radiodurans R1 = ATCC 13939 = DSM 20539]1J5A_K Chain K, RIBOSOMAL PROTEIN L4 [Deinococcus radiodurans]1JZX_K Chain K, Ribosomal Protein L4 [Deinococcus radiodurans]1JZY_K Chain K, Ribosomal Protein L4 [Deinococcus radiodurans]1JZZ_K Chain K, Ribosomal Protein L4 [Deinococcus radiodurans]1K01_K Chain K, Ribosomal Protein L4 [Deinoc
MAQINVIGQNGGRTIELPLPEVNSGVLHEVVTWQLASRRRGTASTRTRAQVSKTGRKMYGQKGTGNARHGDRSVPTFVGGGVAFGPKPRSYDYTLPRQVRQLGLAMAIASRQEGGKLVAVDGFDIADAKTKNFISWAKQNGLDGTEKVLLVTDDENTRRAARNVSWVSVLPVAGVNVYDILRHDRLVIDAAALEIVEEEAGEEQQ